MVKRIRFPLKMKKRYRSTYIVGTKRELRPDSADLNTVKLSVSKNTRLFHTEIPM